MIMHTYGNKEDYYKNSTPLVRDIYPDANVIIREDYAHCEYMAKHPEEYIAFIENPTEIKKEPNKDEKLRKAIKNW